MPLLRSIPFDTSPDYAAMLDDLDFMAPMRSRFAIPEYNGRDATYFATHQNGLTPISAQYLYQHFYKKWNNFHVLQPEKWKQIVQEQYQDVIAYFSRLLQVEPQQLIFDSDGQALLTQLINDYPEITHCNTLVQSTPEVFKQYYAWTYHELEPSEMDTEGIVNFIINVLEPHTILYLPSIAYNTGNALYVDFIRKAAITKNIVIVWDISLAINNMYVDLSAANVLYAIFRTNSFLSGGAEGIYGSYASHSTSFKHPIFPLLSATNLIASIDLLAKTSIKEIREKCIDLFSYFSLLLADLGGYYKVITNPETLGLSAYFILKSPVPIYEFLIKNGFVVTACSEYEIAISFSALYNSYQDVYRLYLLLKDYQNYAEN